MTTATLNIEVLTRDWAAPQHEWVPLCPDDGKENAELRSLIASVGRWSNDTDSDVIGGAEMPPWVRKAERRIEELSRASAPIPLRGKDPVSLRCSDPSIGLRVEMQVRNKLSENDPLGYSPSGEFEVAMHVFRGDNTINRLFAWTSEALIHQAHRDWQGTGDVREEVYRIAAAMLDAARDRLRPARFNGFGHE